MTARKGEAARALKESLEALAKAHPVVETALAHYGPPEPRVRPGGFGTLARIVVGQQVSTHAARAIGDRLARALGGRLAAQPLLAASDEVLRGAGLSGQKVRYLRALAVAVESGELPLRRLPSMSDEAVVEAITGVLGFGVWSAHMYLLFSLGRQDVWPAGDLAVRGGFGRLLGWEARPTEAQVREASTPFAPHRSALALLCWRVYSAAPL